MKTFAEWLEHRDPKILEAMTGWKKALGLGLAGLGIGTGGYMAGKMGTQNAAIPSIKGQVNQSYTSPEAGKFLEPQIPSVKGFTSTDAGNFVDVANPKQAGGFLSRIPPEYYNYYKQQLQKASGLGEVKSQEIARRRTENKIKADTLKKAGKTSGTFRQGELENSVPSKKGFLPDDD